MVSDLLKLFIIDTAPTSRGKSLAKDEGGAIMIMGLAMILALIAFMWFAMGIGETLVFRDHMQDAADSAAFSQAAVEAAGMNLIVFVNMLILLLVMVYIIASIILTIYWAIMVVNLLLCLDVFGGELDCLAGLDQLAEYPGLYDDRGDLGTLLSNLDKGLSYLESGAALLAPWAGTAASVDATSDFKIKSQEHAIGVSLAGTNIPDGGALSGTSTKDEYGLPVTHEHLGNDCAHLIDMMFNLIGDGVKSIFGGGKGTSKIMSLLNSAGGVFAGTIQWYYCATEVAPPFPLPGFVDDILDFFDSLPIREIIGGGDANKYWEEDGYGPMENFKHKNIVGDDNHIDLVKFAKNTDHRADAERKNDADHNQSYSFVITPGAYDEHNASKNIGLMQLQHEKFMDISEQKPTTIFYFAQAELYFDCDKKWRSPNCDQLGDTDRVDMTMYRFEWRARLVKFHPPKGGLTTALNMINKVLGMVTDVKGYINGGASNPFIKALKFLDDLTGVDFIGMIGRIADMPPDQIFH